MDEERMPYELKIKLFIAFIIILIQLILFPLFNKGGFLLLFGILIFLFIFSSKDKKTKKQKENEFLKYDDSWFKSKYNLSKEIP